MTLLSDNELKKMMHYSNRMNSAVKQVVQTTITTIIVMITKNKITIKSTNSLIFMLLMLLINASCIKCFSEETKPTELITKVGSHVVFNCRIDFPYEIHIPYIINWSKDGKNIFTYYDGEISSSDKLFAGRLSLLDNNGELGKASINLTSIRESDQGWYHCQIIFPNRTPSTRNNGTWYNLVVEGSLIKIPPINQTIMEGKTAFINCVMKYPDYSMVIWYKDNTELKELTDLQRRSRTSPDGSLNIDPTMMSDSGEYECKVINTLDNEEQTAKAFLNIQFKAKVIYAPPEVYLPYGQPGVLDCHFRANPPLMRLKWEKDGLLFDPHNVPGVYLRNNGSLFFTRVDESHAGSYTCTPYNELGTDGPSPIINVIVQRPPIFILTPKPIYINKLGENVTMSCDAIDRDGSHHPSIVWSRKDGTPLPLGRYSVDGGNLTIVEIIESDRGIYQCSATNEAATIIADTELMIENIAPRPPYNLTANSSQTSITIHWQPGYIRPHLEYIVWYRLSSAAEWRTMRTVSKNVMEATINNLLPGREYEFMVLSQDKYGDGMFSKAFRFSTKPKDPSQPEIIREQSVQSFTQLGPPKNLTVQLKSDGFVATWEPPEYGLELFRFYIVRWWYEPDHVLHGSAETTDTNYIVRHLKENSQYRIQIFSLSVNDDQIGSNIVEILVPSQRKMRAIAIGLTVSVLFLITAISIFLYVKRSCFHQTKSNT